MPQTDMLSFERLLKLRKMSADEIRVRLLESAWRFRERMSVRTAKRRGSTVVANSEPAESLLTRATQFVPGAASSQFQALRDESPRLYTEICERLAGRVDALRAGRWESLGHVFDLSGECDWHRDPRFGHRWPREFYADVRIYEIGGGVDVKHVWELSRHQFLFELSAHWSVSGDKQAAQHASRLLLDWIENNPNCVGVNWTSALECAMRLISWAWTLAALSEWDGWSRAQLSQVAGSVGEHARYLLRHLSYYSSPFNHLIGEAAGLYLAGCWLTGNEADEWRKVAREVLLGYSQRQFSADGFTVEQACGYHFYILGFLTLAREASRHFGNELSGLDRILQTAWKAAAVLRQPDGRWSPFGDLDSARSLPVLPADYWDFRSVLSIGAARYGDETVLAAAEEPGEELFWLTGIDGVRQFNAQRERGKPPECAVLPDAGYAIGRSRKLAGEWLLFDSGPISGGLFADSTPSTAHGHADLLQVLLFHDGKPVLLDSGIDAYAGDIHRVDWFRSPAAHNTLEVDGAPMVRPAGRLSWSHTTTSQSLKAFLNDDFWVLLGSYSRPEGVEVDRAILGLPGLGVWIADRVRTSIDRRCVWTWHPNAAIATGELRKTETGVGAEWSGMTFEMRGSQEFLNSESVRSLPGHPAGWKCLDYGQTHPGFLIRVEQLCRAPGTTVMTGFVYSECRVEVRFREGGETAGWPAEIKPPAGDHFVEWLFESPAGAFRLVLGSKDHPTPQAEWFRCEGTGDATVWRAAIPSPFAKEMAQE